MPVYLKYLVSGCGLLLLAACATPPDPDCLVDWRETGRVDGRLGQPVETYETHAEHCPGLSEEDRVAWHEGWESGIKEHCTAQNGLDSGLAGEPLTRVCPDTLARPFRAGHRLGQELGEAYSRKSELEAEIAELSESDDNPQRLRRARARLTAAQRRISTLERRISALGLGLTR